MRLFFPPFIFGYDEISVVWLDGRVCDRNVMQVLKKMEFEQVIAFLNIVNNNYRDSMIKGDSKVISRITAEYMKEAAFKYN